MTDFDPANASVSASHFWQARGSILLPILLHEGTRPIAWHAGQAITRSEFLTQVASVVARLPASGAMINLCEDRYHFLATYTAALVARHRVLLPPTRVEQVVTEIESLCEGSYRIDDSALASAAPPTRAELAMQTEADAIVMIGYTSGSTGQPAAQPKRWRALHASAAHNGAAVRRALGVSDSELVSVIATVPPQHMYGMELSVLLPLLSGMAVHSGRPLFPADIARALEEIPEPRVLVSTPVHLRAMLQSAQTFPRIALVVSATAPLDKALASLVESKLSAPLLEMFGSTETCVIATRRTAEEDSWRSYDGVALEPMSEGTRVSAPWFDQPIMLQDVVELECANRFIVRGRNADMIEVAGKRASLGDLTRRLLSIQGVKDAAVFQPDQTEVGTIYRVAAAVVAPGMSARQILERLANSVDPAFLPRPLILVDSLPRNEVGKLPRGKLLELLASRSAG